jgi:hypothetical protein
LERSHEMTDIVVYIADQTRALGQHDALVESGLRPADFERKLVANLSGCPKASDALIHIGTCLLRALAND